MVVLGGGCVLMSEVTLYRIRAKREQLEMFQALVRERQGQNLALTALTVPYSLHSGLRQPCHQAHGL
jgi:hypothetical protein